MALTTLLKNSTQIRILLHHIYEIHKGLRNLVLLTLKSSEQSHVVQILTEREIAFHVQPSTDRLINIFFGQKACVDIIKSFGIKKLSLLTPEQDFMLGTMLGYCQMQQCDRYIKKTKKLNAEISDVA